MNLIELTHTEMLETNGGERKWTYYLGWAVGATIVAGAVAIRNAGRAAGEILEAM